MSVSVVTVVRSRRLLHRSIVFLAILMLAGSSWDIWATTASLAAEPQALPASQEAEPGAPAGTSSVIETVVLDNNTLASMIAAENAALTPSQFLVELPAVIR